MAPFLLFGDFLVTFVSNTEGEKSQTYKAPFTQAIFCGDFSGDFAAM